MTDRANGTYGLVYCGAVSVGIGVFNIKDGILRGLDLGGGRYEGTVRDDPSTAGFEFAFSMFIPSGVFLVQGTSPLDVPHSRGANVTMPADFSNGEPIKLIVAPGEITVMIRRITDDYTPWAFSEKVSLKVS